MLYSMNETKKRATAWAGAAYDFLWDSDNITVLTIYNSTWNESINLTNSAGSIYNYSGYTIGSATYNFSVDTSTENITITRQSDAASWEVENQRVGSEQIQWPALALKWRAASRFALTPIRAVAMNSSRTRDSDCVQIVSCRRENSGRYRRWYWPACRSR